MVYKDIDKNNLIEVDSVSKYIEEIRRLRNEKYMEVGTSTEFYFRGQEVEFWDIEPSIFRNNMLSVENKLMQMPLIKIPMEFKGLDSMFDIMAKYQHYGMCTRLLDLTSNPLVALYFACKIHGNEQYETEDGIEEKEPYGVVYYTDKYYTSQATDKEVKIISALASYDLNKENSICAILDKLELDNIIDGELKEDWKNGNKINEFIDIIQRNYMVIPTYTNERLRRQNGVFLLASMFSISISSSNNDGIISKSKSNLRNDFSECYFYIRGENKGEILKELDLYNINEATLFPELEHQLNHIRYAHEEYTQAVSEFTKYEKMEEREANFVYVDDSEMNNYLLNNLELILNDTIEKKDLEDIKNIIKNNLSIDWYNRISTSSKIRMALTSFYFVKNNGADREKSKEMANKILYLLNEEVKKYIEQKEKGGEANAN